MPRSYTMWQLFIFFQPIQGCDKCHYLPNFKTYVKSLMKVNYPTGISVSLAGARNIESIVGVQWRQENTKQSVHRSSRKQGLLSFALEQGWDFPVDTEQKMEGSAVAQW